MNPFRPVKSGKISGRIVQQIKGAILRGAMKPGDRLPPERKLVERFRASRISVREALKNLEVSGLLTIKPGSGVFVAEANSKPLSESLSSILRIQKATLNELTEARVILEPPIAKLAVEKMTAEDLMKLESNIDEASKIVKSHAPSPTQNIEFHSLIAEATHNTVITLAMKTLLGVVKEMTLELRDGLEKRVKISSHAVDYHKKIIKALRKRDSQKVYDLMLKHILQIQGGLREVKPNKK
ncbi:MAG: FadR/GntR family transcriptional regulator [Deltaproteobacteria bacterium]|nr:FadR/GntR family transcriptional regulator [Deltaproteobacteria bacterium]